MGIRSVNPAETGAAGMARAGGGVQPDSLALGAEALTATEWGSPLDKEQEVKGQERGRSEEGQSRD